jgi:uncharacterized protein (DUF433 family)
MNSSRGEKSRAARVRVEVTRMATATQGSIVRDAQGVAYIDGTTAKVSEVVLNLEWAGQTPEELQRDMPHLSLGQIQAAVEHYLQHREEVETEIQHDDELAARIRREAGESPFSRRLRAAGKRP